MESWRKAWRDNAPVEPYEDVEWVEQHPQYFQNRSDPATASDEVAGMEYRRIQALWLLDHVDILEEAGEMTPEVAAWFRNQKPR
jgi:hypothetical protein